MYTQRFCPLRDVEKGLLPHRDLENVALPTGKYSSFHRETFLFQLGNISLSSWERFLFLLRNVSLPIEKCLSSYWKTFFFQLGNISSAAETISLPIGRSVSCPLEKELSSLNANQYKDKDIIKEKLRTTSRNQQGQHQGEHHRHH